MAELVDYEFVVNPKDPNDWNSCVEQSFATEGWRLSYDDKDVLTEIFGEENFQLTVIKSKASPNAVIGFVFFAVHQSVDDSPKFGYLGCFYVRPEYRGHGLGMKLWDFVLEKERGLNLMLNAALSMSLKYATRQGFIHMMPYQLRNVQVLPADLQLTGHPEPVGMDSALRIVSPETIDMEKILNFDRTIQCRVNRRRYLSVYFRRPDAISKIAVDGNGEVVGMCTVKRICGNRLMFCPLYANDETIAQRLLTVALQAYSDLSRFDYIQFYVPSTNLASFNLIDRISQGRSKRGTVDDQSQFTRHTFPVPIEKVFCNNAYGLTLI